MIPVSTVVNEARDILIDAAKVTWADSELIGYLNEFARTTAQVKHDLHTIREAIGLEAGVSQEVTSDINAVALLDITSNVASGTTVTQVDKALLDETNRFWPADDQTTDVDNFSMNVKEPLRFYVTPPNNGYGLVNAVLGVIPEAVAALDDPWPVHEQWQAAAVNFVLARAYAKNSQKQDLVKSNAYMQEWGKLIGLKSTTQIAFTPKVTDTPEAR